MLDPPPPRPQECARISLADAFLRVDRAGEHLADLKARVEEYTEAQKDKITIELEPGVFGITNAVEEPPRMFSVLVGETIQNLRTALDYLVYALSWLDAGAHQTMTQFPIEDSSEGFDGRRTTYLKALSDEHVAAIERLQPFNGGEWLRALRGASNQDKHWALHVTVVQGHGTIHFPASAVGSTSEGFAVEGEVNVHHDQTIDVAFPDGTPILKPLEVLQSCVRGVLDSFKPDFESWPRTRGHPATPPTG